MALPIPLLLLIYPIIKVVAKLITGAATAGIIYYFLTNVVRPYMDQLTNNVYNTVSQFSTVGGTSIQVIHYLDFPNLISLLLSCSAACFSIKIMSVAVRAFGINTG